MVLNVFIDLVVMMRKLTKIDFKKVTVKIVIFFVCILTLMKLKRYNGQMKFKKLKQKFEDNMMKDQKILADFKFLDRYVSYVFPTKAEVEGLMYHKNLTDRKMRFLLHARSLPFHTREDEWLALYLEQAVAQIFLTEREAESKRSTCLDSKTGTSEAYESISSIDQRSFLQYVKLSPKFEAMRTRYEHYLVKDYVHNWVKGQSYDFYYTEEEKQKFVQKTNYEDVFRESVIDAMVTFGLPQKSIEEGLELSASIWLMPAICRGLMNESGLHSDEFYALEKYEPAVTKELFKSEFKSMAAAARLREYKYYLKHREVIDRMGTATKNMKMSQEEASKLEQVVRNNAYKSECLMFNQIACLLYSKEINADLEKKSL